MIAILLLLVAQAAPGRVYHVVPLAAVATTSWTHVCTSGPVVYVRRMKDTDWHITLSDGTAKVVVEIIVEIPLTVPKRGQTIRACGITRWDRRHRWGEIHPATSIDVIESPSGPADHRLGR